jgi:phage repressor protein C with HTH and peptisase S24 domain
VAGTLPLRRAADQESCVGWATPYIELLRAGERVSLRPTGNSMSPLIESGELCTVIPVAPATLAAGDIVLCTVDGQDYLHLVIAVEPGRFQIGNNRGHVDGWVGPEGIHGKCIEVERCPT